MTATRSPHALRLDSLGKVYGSVAALDGVTLTLPHGSFTAVMGPPGSGKSTLLHCAAGLEEPTAGRVHVDGAELTFDSERDPTTFRRRRLGFVSQQVDLLPSLTVLQNVTLPLRLAGAKVDGRRCRSVLEQVGLGDRLHHRPAELSGAQQQRVVIARALVTEPSLILADEPAGALDARSARAVLALLQEAVDVYDQTVVMVTQDPAAAAYAGTVLFLAGGRIAGRLDDPTAEAVADRLSQLGDDTAAA
jgi:putative ABC transport system ATP-binding protein